MVFSRIGRKASSAAQAESAAPSTDDSTFITWNDCRDWKSVRKAEDNPFYGPSLMYDDTFDIPLHKLGMYWPALRRS